MTNDRTLLATLQFETMYGTCYRLAQAKEHKQLLRLFYSTLKAAAQLHRDNRESYERVTTMLRDVFMFPTIVRFGGHVASEFSVSEEIESVWSEMQARRASLRPR